MSFNGGWWCPHSSASNYYIIQFCCIWTPLRSRTVLVLMGGGGDAGCSSKHGHLYYNCANFFCTCASWCLQPHKWGAQDVGTSIGSICSTTKVHNIVYMLLASGFFEISPEKVLVFFGNPPCIYVLGCQKIKWKAILIGDPWPSSYFLSLIKVWSHA